MKALVIGGTRFLGSAIVRELLARGHSVAVLHRGETPGDLPEAVPHILCDARDRHAVEPHLAAGSYDAVIDTILGADELAWCLPLLARHTHRLVHCGSTGVYTPMSSVPVREDDPTPCPAELGGFGGKLQQDEALVRFHEQTGYRVCSLRISNVFGPGDVPLDVWGARNPAYFQRVADGKEIWIPNDGRALLQPVHVADLARGFAAVAEADVWPGLIYNLSSPQAVTLAHYVAVAKDLLGSKSSVRCIPMEEILALGKTSAAGLRFVCEHMCVDSAKAQQDFGYTPRIGVRDGLRDSLNWMIDQGLLRATQMAGSDLDVAMRGACEKGQR